MSAPRRFRLTLFPAPTVRPGGDPNVADGVFWPKHGRLWEGDAAALVALLTTPVPAPGKYACPYFVAGRLRDQERSNDAFEAASVVALDVDTGITTWDAHGRFLDLFHVIYTSWKHSREEHRFRLVLPLARDVSPTEYKLLWAVLARRLGGNVDGQTKDLARALFLPARRPDGRRAGAKAWDEVPLLDPDALLVDALRLVQPPRRPPSEPVTVPPELAYAVAARRLSNDPDVRRRAAEHLQATVRETRAERISCPKCGRPSVWFWIDPSVMKTARCNHRNSCGWWGRLEDLLDGAGASCA